MEKKDYNFFNRKFNTEADIEDYTSWKKSYKEKTNEMFKEILNSLTDEERESVGGIYWGFCEKNGRYGILDRDGNWSIYNNQNTHPNLCCYFYNISIDENAVTYFGIGEISNNKTNAFKLVRFILSKENFLRFYNEKSNYFHMIQFLLHQSWENGNNMIIVSVLSLQEAFPDNKKINFGFERGTSKDFGGVDMDIIYFSDATDNIQVKSGNYDVINDGCIVYGGKSIVNKYLNCGIIIFSDIKNGMTSSIIFKNSQNFKVINQDIIIKKSDVIFHTKKHMPVPEKIKELMKLCGKQKIVLYIRKEDSENYVKIEEKENGKILIINFYDHTDEDFEKLLDEKIDLLK